jgi:hypothetical protein
MRMPISKAQRLRAELALLRARYDSGAVASAVYQTIKEIETKIAWAEHRAKYATAPFGDVGQA